MNEMVPRPARAPANTVPETRGRKIARSLAHIRQTLLKPFDDYDALREANPDLPKLAYRTISEGGLSAHFVTPEGALRRPPTWQGQQRDVIELIERRLATLPPLMDLMRVKHALDNVERSPTDADKTMVVVGLMVDAFPTARPHDPETYQEALLLELRVAGYGPEIVAKACNEIVRTKVFLPTISELLTLCQETRGRAESSRRMLESLLAGYADLSKALPLLRACEDLPETDPWQAELEARRAERAAEHAAKVDRGETPF